MAYVYSAIKATVQAAATALGRTIKLSLGSSGEMEYPASGAAKKVRDTGMMWETGESPLDFILKYAGAELDRAHLCWAVISTNGASVAPTILGSSRITSCTKNEPSSQITIAFTVPFLSANGYVADANTAATAGCSQLTSRQVGQVTVDFISPVTGLQMSINSLTVLFWAVGAV